MIRYPVVAGSFYPDSKSELIDTLKNFFGELPERKDDLIPVTGLISPHAGYVFSGKTASYGYYEIFKKGKIKSVIIIGPNHTGIGPDISVYSDGSWITPLGEVEIDEKALSLLSKLNINGDYSAHKYEHSIEVQLPFLQYLYGNNFKIIPIVLGNQSLETSKKLAIALKEIADDGTLIIASSDMNHYESHEITLKKDEFIIDALKKNNPELLYDYVKEYNITACGYGCINTLLYFGFNKTRILYHTTSAEAFGDYYRTVGYLSAILE